MSLLCITSLTPSTFLVCLFLSEVILTRKWERCLNLLWYRCLLRSSEKQRQFSYSDPVKFCERLWEESKLVEFFLIVTNARSKIRSLLEESVGVFHSLVTLSLSLQRCWGLFLYTKYLMTSVQKFSHLTPTLSVTTTSVVVYVSVH